MGTSASGYGWRAGERVVACTFLVLVLISASVAAQEVVHARVSFDGGGGLVKGTWEEDWSYLTLNSLILPGDAVWVDEHGAIEVEMAGGTFLRMADETNAEIVSLPPSALVCGWVGAFYVQRLRFSSGRMALETPLCQVIVGSLSLVRVDILDDGTTTVTVRQGNAQIRMEDGQTTLVMRGQRAYVDPGYVPSRPEAFNSDDEDAFDRWSRERAELVAAAVEAVPAGVGIKAGVIGAEDLSTYGDWIQVDSEYCWQPRVDEDFVPYRDGYWSYVPACGYVWVGRHPFSYITMHYGRWLYEPGAGWFWVYRDTWAPAWAATLRFGSTFLWCPLDLWGRPIATSAECIAVGGMHFGVYATTCCAADDLLAGRCRAFACTPVFADGLRNARAEIWRTFTNSRNPVFVTYNDPSMRARNYAPRRVIRGPDLPGPGKPNAPARAAALESKTPHAPRNPETAAPQSGVKPATAPESQPVRVRTVHIEARALADIPRSAPRPAAKEVPDAETRPQAATPRVTRLGVRHEAEAPAADAAPEAAPAPEDSQRSPARTVRSRDAEESPPSPPRASEESPRQRVVESPAPVIAPPPPPPPVEIQAPVPEVRRQAPEPISEPIRAIRSEPPPAPPVRQAASTPPPPPPPPPASPVQRHDLPSAPAPIPSRVVEAPPPAPAPTPSRTVETPPSTTSSPTRSEDSSRSIRGSPR